MSHWKCPPSEVLICGKNKFDIGKATELLGSLLLLDKLTLSYYIVLRMCVCSNNGDLVWELISPCVFLNYIYLGDIG